MLSVVACSAAVFWTPTKCSMFCARRGQPHVPPLCFASVQPSRRSLLQMQTLFLLVATEALGWPCHHYTIAHHHCATSPFFGLAIVVPFFGTSDAACMYGSCRGPTLCSRATRNHGYAHPNAWLKVWSLGQPRVVSPASHRHCIARRS
jgi:hypothetical protein